MTGPGSLGPDGGAGSARVHYVPPGEARRQKAVAAAITGGTSHNYTPCTYGGAGRGFGVSQTKRTGGVHSLCLRGRVNRLGTTESRVARSKHIRMARNVALFITCL